MLAYKAGDGTRFAVSILAQVMVSSLCGYGLALLNGSLNTAIAWFALGCGVAGAIGTYRRSANWFSPKAASQELHQPTLHFAELVFYTVIAYFLFRHGLHLFYATDEGWLTGHAHNFGDLPLHLTYIRQIAAGAKMPLMNPQWPGELLRYPVGMDFYNALWEQVGVVTTGPLFLSFFILSLVTVIALHRLGRWWVVGAFFMSGGFIGWMNAMGRPSASFPAAYAWKDFLTSVWITQRGFLWALPAGALALYFVLQPKLGRAQKIAVAIVLGALGFFHLHTMFILIFLLVGLWLLQKRWRDVLVVLAMAVPLALPFVLHSTDFFRRASVIRWRGHWLAGAEGPLAFWFWNLGSVVLVAFWLLWEVVKGRDKEWRHGVLFTLAAFALFTSLIMAPWEWDNIKILLWPYLLVFYFVHLLARRLQTRWLPLAIGGAVFLPGLWINCKSLPGAHQKISIYSHADIQATGQAVQGLAVNAIFAAVPTHNHPLTFFGKIQALGYDGHLWSHGINAGNRRQELALIMSGAPGWRELARSLGINYIFWGARERQEYGSDDKPWMSELRNVSVNQEVGVYALE